MSIEHEQIFRDFVEEALSRSRTLIDRVTRTVIDELEKNSFEALTSRERQAYRDVLTELRIGQRSLVESFVDNLSREAYRQYGIDSPQSGNSVDMSLENFALIDDARLQEDVEIVQLIQLIEAKAEWELQDFNSRMSSLKGSKTVDVRHNPIRPELFGRTLQRAMSVLPISGEQRVVLVRAFGNSLSAALRETYSEYSRRLKAQGINPVAYGIRSISGAGTAVAAQISAAAPAAAQPAAAAMAEEQAKPVEARGFAANLRKLFSGRAAALDAASDDDDDQGPPSVFGGAVSANEALRGVLSQVAMLNANTAVMSQAILSQQSALQQVQGQHAAEATVTVPTNVIHQYKDDLLKVAQRPLERLTIDVVARMFDHILADKNLLPAIKAQIGRLQLPVLRVALEDPSIFSDRAHPSRRLINLLASYPSGFVSAEHPRFKQFMHHADQVVETVVSTADKDVLHVFKDQLAFIEQSIARFSREEESQAAPTVDTLTRAENRAVLLAAKRQQINHLLRSAEVEDYLASFLRNDWSHVLAESAMQYGAKSVQTERFQETASDLVWSVQPKVTAHDRQHFVKQLGALVQGVQEGLGLIEYPAEKQRQFLAQLMATHSRLIKADKAAQKAALKATAPSAGAPEALRDRLSRAWLDSTGDNGPSTFSGDLAVNVAEHERKSTDLIDTPEVESIKLAEPVVEAKHVKIDDLASGTWYEMLSGSDWRKVQLLWKSPRGLFFVFSTDSAGKSHSITRRALDKLCSAGAFRLMEAEGLIDRAVAGVMSSAQNSEPPGTAPTGGHRVH
jgi:hypothetical protein